MIRVLATNLATYPDLSVVCGRIERDPEDANVVINPIVLIEVLSDSTEAYDRGEKFAHYRRIPSLREYVLVSQHQPRIEVFRRNDDGSWTLYEAATSERAKLASIGCELSVDEVYANALATG
jgi:Uma2 family endonuclease